MASTIRDKVLDVDCPECGAKRGDCCTHAGVFLDPSDSHTIRYIVDTQTIIVGDAVNHPAHYGGEDNPYEAVKVIEAWGLGFNLGNTVKYIARAEHKGATLQDLQKAAWYLAREIANRERAFVRETNQ